MLPCGIRKGTMSVMHEISNGVWPTMITPFTADGQIDYDGVLDILSFYEARGVDGVFAVCQSSEMFYLSLAERKALAKFIAQNLPKGMEAIVSGHTADDLDAQIREAQEIYTDGMSAYVILPNRFAAADESDDVLLERMSRFTDAVSGIPLGMYECPYPYKRLVSEPVLRYAIDSKRYHFLKDTCCDIDQIRAKLAVTKGSPLKLFNANTATLLESLQAGAAGFSGIMANIHPELYHWLCEQYAKEPQKAESLQYMLTVSSQAEAFAYPACAKHYMALEGVSIAHACRSIDTNALTPLMMRGMAHLQGLTRDTKQWLGMV